MNLLEKSPAGNTKYLSVTKMFAKRWSWKSWKKKKPTTMQVIGFMKVVSLGKLFGSIEDQDTPHLSCKTENRDQPK